MDILWKCTRSAQQHVDMRRQGPTACPQSHAAFTCPLKPQSRACSTCSLKLEPFPAESFASSAGGAHRAAGWAPGGAHSPIGRASGGAHSPARKTFCTPMSGTRSFSAPPTGVSSPSHAVVPYSDPGVLRCLGCSASSREVLWFFYDVKYSSDLQRVESRTPVGDGCESCVGAAHDVAAPAPMACFRSFGGSQLTCAK